MASSDYSVLPLSLCSPFVPLLHHRTSEYINWFVVVDLLITLVVSVCMPREWWFGTLDGFKILIIRVPGDPVLELCYPRVHAGPVAVSAPDSPADDPGQLVPAVPALDHHGAARVALARVLTAVGGSRADEDARYPLVLTRAAVHRHALRDKMAKMLFRYHSEANAWSHLTYYGAEESEEIQG